MNERFKHFFIGVALVCGLILLLVSFSDQFSTKRVSSQGESKGRASNMAKQKIVTLNIIDVAFAAQEKESEDAEDDEDEGEAERTWSFDKDKAGTILEGWEAAETSGQGKPAT